MTDQRVSPETISVWTCEGCGRRLGDAPRGHVRISTGRSCRGPMREDVYVHADREAWIRLIAACLAGKPRCHCPDYGFGELPDCPEHGFGEWPRDHHRRKARIIVDAILASEPQVTS